MIVAALGVIAGGGTAGYFYFSKPAEASTPGEVKKQADSHKASADGHAAPQNMYYTMDPLVLPVISEEGLSQVINMVIVLEVSDEAAKDKVKYMAPRIKDAFIQDMYGVLNKHAALQGGVVQVRVIKDRLNQIANRVMGDGSINDVLLQVVDQRPM